MIDPMHSQLLGHLLGALDDDEQEWVEGQLEHDNRYRRYGLRWRQRLAVIDAIRPEFEPPRGLAERTCQLVAAWSRIAWPKRRTSQRWKMTPEAFFPSRAAHVAWGDVAAVALIAMVAFAMIVPAIYGSRFQARLIACQNNMRQFGSAMLDYGDRHGNAPSQLMANGGLTPAGVLAAGAIEEVVATNGNRALCPDAWLAAQGINPSDIHRVPTVQDTSVTSLPLCPKSEGIVESNNRWPGTWRNGTRDDRREESLLTALPLMADVPSARLPGQNIAAHDGLGSNVFFADGQIRFLRYAALADGVDLILSGDLQ